MKKPINGINTKHRCPQCNTSSHDYQSAVKHFGMRNMGNGVVRIQSYCRNCR